MSRNAPMSNAERQARHRQRRAQELAALRDASRSQDIPVRRELAARLDALQQEISRRRKANKDERDKARWNHEAIVTRFQTELLDWIQQWVDDERDGLRNGDDRTAGAA